MTAGAPISFMRASVSIFVMLLLAGCSSSPSSNGGAVSAAPSAEPAAVLLAYSGRVEGRSETVEVGAAMDGVLTTVLVKEGQAIRKGTRLAEIGCPDLEAALPVANSELESARQLKLRLLRGSREEERRMSAERTAAALASLERASLQLGRMQALHSKSEVSRSTLDDARRDYDVAEATLREAKEHERLVNAPPLPEEVAKADADIAAAENRAWVIREKLNKCIIKAPMDGTILRILLHPGESFSTITPRPLFSMADLSTKRVRAEIDERDLMKVRVGQKVLVYPEANQDRKFSGTVASLASAMGRKKILLEDPSQKVDRDVLEAMIDLEPRAAKLPLGMRVIVESLR